MIQNFEFFHTFAAISCSIPGGAKNLAAWLFLAYYGKASGYQIIPKPENSKK